MITTYHRPKSLDEALTLLAKPGSLPLGGGTLLSQGIQEQVEVVDLQAMGLDRLQRKGTDLEIGATVTLQHLLESEDCPPELKAALRLEAPLNLRNAATVAGTLVAADGRSPCATSLLALDARLVIHQTEASTVTIGEYLPLRPRGLITAILIPLNAGFAFEGVSRTPSDKPIVCTAVARWPSGRIRLAVGGFGKNPALAMDGTGAEGVGPAASNACHEAADEFASSAYRMDAAATLAVRCLQRT